MSSISSMDRAFSRILTVCAVIVVGLLVEARISRPEPPMAGPAPRVEQVVDWEQRFAGSAVALDDTGTVSVLVFTDFQCPFCALLDSALADFVVRRPGVIRRHVVHYPLPGNEHAFPAAVAFECAQPYGVARAMHDVLFAEQRNRRLSLGAWSQMAIASGVTDRMLFDRCTADTLSHRRVIDGIRLGRELQIRGTPTALVGGWLVEPSTPATVEAAVDAVLSGKAPQPLRSTR
jgi:protein-disulfide isomerase